MLYFLYILSYIFFCNWFQIYSFASVFFGSKNRINELHDPWIQSTVKKKTGLSLLSISLFHDKKMYGMMPGFPLWPKMILSEGLYKTLNRDELEWVILHETAHCVFWHNAIAAFLQISVLTTSIWIIQIMNPPLIIIPILSIFSSILCIQSIRWIVEYAADSYSIARVDNPIGVISAQKKFKDSYAKNLFNREGSIIRLLFHWNIPASKRISMAKKRIDNSIK